MLQKDIYNYKYIQEQLRVKKERAAQAMGTNKDQEENMVPTMFQGGGDDDSASFGSFGQDDDAYDEDDEISKQVLDKINSNSEESKDTQD